MDKTFKLFSELGFNLNYGQCLDLIKLEYLKAVAKFETLKQEDASLNEIRDAFHLVQAYDVLISTFEKYLGHEF